MVPVVLRSFSVQVLEQLTLRYITTITAITTTISTSNVLEHVMVDFIIPSCKQSLEGASCTNTELDVIVLDVSLVLFSCSLGLRRLVVCHLRRTQQEPP